MAFYGLSYKNDGKDFLFIQCKTRILVRNFNSALLFLYPAAMFLFKISNLKRARAEFFTQIRIDKKGEKMP